jgi:hypothetical protein
MANINPKEWTGFIEPSRRGNAMLFQTKESMEEWQEERLKRLKTMTESIADRQEKAVEEVPFFSADMGKYTKLKQLDMYKAYLELISDAVTEVISEVEMTKRNIEECEIWDKRYNVYVSHDEAIWNEGCHEGS